MGSVSSSSQDFPQWGEVNPWGESIHLCLSSPYSMAPGWPEALWQTPMSACRLTLNWFSTHSHRVYSEKKKKHRGSVFLLLVVSKWPQKAWNAPKATLLLVILSCILGHMVESKFSTSELWWSPIKVSRQGGARRSYFYVSIGILKLL